MLKSKKYVSLLLSLTLAMGVGVCLPSLADDAKNITIVHTNDVHGRAKGDDKELIGYAKLKTFYDEQKAKNPNTLLVDAGDTLHGTTFANISEGKNMLELMENLGVVVSVPGNHDFNYGYQRLVELAKDSKVVYIASNVVRKDGKKDFVPTYIKEVDGVKIGFFGIATPETKYKSSPKNTQDVEFVDYIASAKEQVEKLKSEGAQVIIAVTHLGLDQSSKERSDILAQEVKGIDLIIDGHSHTILPEGKKVNDTTIVQTGEYLKNIGVVDLSVKDGKVDSIKPQIVSYSALKDTKEDEEIAKKIKEAEEKNKPMLEKKIGKTETELQGKREEVRTRETNLGDLVTDAMKKSVDADVAITNGGGIRASIKKGDITMGDVLTAFPFTNFVVGIEVKGDTIKSALEHGLDKAPEAAGKFPQVSGLEVVYDNTKPAGQRVVSVQTNGEKLDMEKTYKLATNDFMSIGGDDYKMFAGSKKYAENALLSDVIVDYIKNNNGVVDYKDIPSRIKPLTADDIKVKNNDTTSTDIEPTTKGVMPVSHKLVINNKAVNIDGYMIDGKIYFQIRDIAAAFKDSKTPFDVKYDKATKTVVLKSNVKYTGSNNKLNKNEANPQLQQTTQKILLNDQVNKTFKVYLINSSNYFNLEEVSSQLKLGVN